VHRIDITGYTGIQIDIGFRDRFGKFGRVAYLEFIDGFSDHNTILSNFEVSSLSLADASRSWG